MHGLGEGNRLPENRLWLRQIAVNLRKKAYFPKRSYETAQAHNETKRISRVRRPPVKQAVAAHSKKSEKTKLDLNGEKVFSILENHLPAGLKTAGQDKRRNTPQKSYGRGSHRHLVAVAPRIRKHVKAFMALGNKTSLFWRYRLEKKKHCTRFLKKKKS